ncbi:zinc transporter ZntB [Thalassotalea mangrovi]|uniref:Zinc transporter ZntB n=1 Tax=Thalassotalea mangrovi TaxID=2572245 RepID=A0A4U1B4X3_9GAMM|nr:zinc transporter ZntB [Thalassotalea mangrovi]TKB45316.1 zinc transporter ZntB [Thalassotalea mangrovi]
MTMLLVEEYDFDLRTQAGREPGISTQPHQDRWLHLNYTNLKNREQLKDFPLDNVITDALLSEETRPRAQLLEGGILLSLRGINLAQDSKPEDMVSVRIFLAQDFILSTGRRKLLSLDKVAHSITSQAGPKTPSAWLADLIENLTDNMAGTVHFIEETLSAFEETAIESKELTFQSELANLRRQIIAIRRYLGPQRDALLTLLSDKNPFIDAEQKIEIRESLNHLQLYIEELDLCKERANVLQEEINVNLGQTMNNRMYVLSIVAAIFLPLGFLTGLLGINVGGMPGADDPNAFYLVSFIMLLITVLLTLLLKKNKWL